jgi:uncharacterized membrane protein
MGNVYLLYFLALLILGGLFALAILNVLRYRYEGDRTLQFVTMFVVAFVLNILVTASILNQRALNAAGSGDTQFEDIFEFQ